MNYCVVTLHKNMEPKELMAPILPSYIGPCWLWSEWPFIVQNIGYLGLHQEEPYFCGESVQYNWLIQ